MINDVKTWKSINSSQFEIIDGSNNHEARRLSDGVIFKRDFPYIYDNGTPTKDGTDVIFFYITSFDTKNFRFVNFVTTKSRISMFQSTGLCLINNLQHTKSGVLEIIQIK